MYRKIRRQHKKNEASHYVISLSTSPLKEPMRMRLPKWLNYPMIMLIIAGFFGVGSYQHVQQERWALYQQQQVDLQVQQQTIREGQKKIDSLIAEKQGQGSQLAEIADMTLALEERLQSLEKEKEAIDDYQQKIEQALTNNKKSNKEASASAEMTERQFSQFGIGGKKIPLGSYVGDAEEVAMTESENNEASSVWMQGLFVKGDTDRQLAQRLIKNQSSNRFEGQVEVIKNKLDGLLGRVERQNQDYQQTSQSFGVIYSKADSYPSIFPLKNATITSSFGPRRNPFGRRVSEFHTGIDLMARYVDFMVTGGGVVISSEYESGYGFTIKVDHGEGLVSMYSHLSKSYVHVGQEVKRGEVIGRSGNSGRSTGPHLHYEIRLHDKPVDPLSYIYKRR